MIDPADSIAIRRAFETTGREGALAELRRRFPIVTDTRAETALDCIRCYSDPRLGGLVSLPG